MVAVQGLTNYKYEKMVTKSLYVLNKYFCMRMDVFKSAAKSQVTFAGLIVTGYLSIAASKSADDEIAAKNRPPCNRPLI